MWPPPGRSMPSSCPIRVVGRASCGLAKKILAYEKLNCPDFAVFSQDATAALVEEYIEGCEFFVAR